MDNVIVALSDGKSKRLQLPFGLADQIVGVLGATGALVDWSVLALQLWPIIDLKRDRDALRRNWDRVLRRLRLTLREHAIRDDRTSSPSPPCCAGPNRAVPA